MQTGQAERINLEDYIREVLDGVTGDIDLPSSYELARPSDAARDGFTDAQRSVYRQIERCLAARARRSLTQSERTKLSIALVSEWNRRAIAASWFHTSDGRYFASDADRRAHQRTLDERASRQASRPAEPRSEVA